MIGCSVKLMAAYLGLSESRVRQVIAEHDIQPIGIMWKAKMYDPADVFKHAGTHDRRRG